MTGKSYANALIIITAFLGTLGGCIPKDPEDTLDRARGGVLRVGISRSAPWVMATQPPRGIEISLVEQLAAELSARIEWETDAESRLFEKLEKWELDLVVCGLRKNNPWSKKVGFSRPYIVIEKEGKNDEHVWAAPPGENAWLKYVQEYLTRSSEDARRLYEEQA